MCLFPRNLLRSDAMAAFIVGWRQVVALRACGLCDLAALAGMIDSRDPGSLTNEDRLPS
jgi:hypothetical protein